MSVFDLHYHHHCQITICSLSINNASVYTYIARREDFLFLFTYNMRELKNRREIVKGDNSGFPAVSNKKIDHLLYKRTMQLEKKENL